MEGADEVLAGEEVDAGLASERGVHLRQQRGGQADVADATHVDGGEEAGDVADDAAAKGEQDGVAVGPGKGELLGEGLDRGEAFVRFACGEKRNGGLMGSGKLARKPRARAPKSGRGDDEEARGLAGCQPAQTRVERAQKAGGDVDVVHGGGGSNANGGHNEVMVSHRENRGAVCNIPPIHVRDGWGTQRQRC